MTRLQQLHTVQDQSPWLDNFTQDSLNDGTLGGPLEAGIRGVTANPTTLASAITGSDAHDQDLEGCTWKPPTGISSPPM